MSKAGKKRLFFWRVYFYGVLMLALAGGASFLVGRYVLQPAFEMPIRPSTTWIAEHMASLLDDRERLQHEITDLKQRVGVEMTLYDANWRLLISNVIPPPPPLSERDLKRLGSETYRFERTKGIVTIFGKDRSITAYCLVQYPPQEFAYGVAAGQLAVVLIVLALASIPLARSVTAPIAKLAQITRAFGAGDYAARAASARKDEIGDLASAFDEMANRIAELRRSEKELIANVSHELRTPLARIRLALELLSDGDRAKATSYLVDIGEDLAELERLLDDVMTTARLDLAADSTTDGLPPLRFETLDARTVLDAAMRRFTKRYPERTLIRHIESELPWLEADPAMLRRVVDNLLDNAVKFSEAEQSIELHASYTRDDSRCVIEVVDYGIGIPAKDVPHVFLPFFRSDPSRARATGGVGLGLTLARRVVEAHAGSISLESRVDSGTRFRVSLPAISHHEAG